MKGNKVKPKLEDILQRKVFDNSLTNQLSIIAQDLADAKDIIDDVIKGIHSHCLVYGAPGMGKSHLVRDAFIRAGKESNEDYVIVSGGTISPMTLYSVLYHMRNKGKFVVLDDCDAILANEIGLSIIKGATDDYTKTVSWATTQTIICPITQETVPSSFKFEGTMIILTNISHTKGASRRAEHYKAITSRLVPVELRYNSIQEQFAQIFYMVYELDYLNTRSETQITWAQKIELLEFLAGNLSIVSNIDLRLPEQLARIVKNNPLTWHSQARRIMRSR